MNMTVIDCTTGDVLVVPMTQQEIAVQEADEEVAISAAVMADTAITNVATIQARLEGELVNLRAYRSLANPSVVQTTAVVKLLCLIVIGLIRLQLLKLEDVG